MKTVQQLRDELVTLRRQRHELQRSVDRMTIEIEATERAWGEAACAFARSEYADGYVQGCSEGAFDAAPDDE